MLVVDDEQHIRRVLEALFRRDGYEVYAAETPQRALALAAETEADVLVADLICRSDGRSDGRSASHSAATMITAQPVRRR